MLHSSFGKIALLTRKGLYIVSYLIDTAMKRKNPITVLCYHSIGYDNWRFTVTPESFKQQILELIKDGYEFITLHDLQQHIEGVKVIAKPSISICFDDGYKGLLEIAPFLSEHGITASVFALSDRAHAQRDELDTSLEFLNIVELKKLHKIGWEIGSHTSTHPNLLSCSKSELTKEIVDSKKQLEKELGSPVPYIAYPKGKYNDEILQLVKNAGYKMGLSMDDDLVSVKTNIYSVPRVGVDKTHGLLEFKGAPTSVARNIRRFVKRKVISN